MPAAVRCVQHAIVECRRHALFVTGIDRGRFLNSAAGGVPVESNVKFVISALGSMVEVSVILEKPLAESSNPPMLALIECATFCKWEPRRRVTAAVGATAAGADKRRAIEGHQIADHEIGKRRTNP